MQCFSTFLGSWPLCYVFTPCDPFLLFFHCIWYYNHYDCNKVLLWKNATNYHNIFTIKMHFITSNFKRQLNFTNCFNECLAVPIFCHARLPFDFVPPFWCELERKKHFRRDILWHNIRKASSDRCRYDSRTALQNQENGISWKLSRADETFPRTQNWSCTSSGILAIAREVENRFLIRASSSSLSSEKYYWNSISRHWRWSIDAFEFLASSSIVSTTLDNFSSKATFVALLHEIGFATSNKMLVDSFRSWMIFVTFPFSFKPRTTFSQISNTFSTKSFY